MAAACQVCEAATSEHLFVKHGYDIGRCLECRHIFVQADISREEMFGMYEVNFFSNGGYAAYLADEPIHRRNFARYVPILRQYSPGGLLFEVGCAYGFFLDLAQRHWRVSGVDISAEAISFARERFGLDVACGDLLELDTKEEAYDVVVMWDTIEHLHNPAAYVAKISRMLKPGGILALTTGDVSSLMARTRGRRWRLYYPPFHLHHFSRVTIARLLQRFGLEVTRRTAVGLYRSADMMLYRAFFDRKPPVSQAIYRIAKLTGLTRPSVYLNLFDIMLVIARKS